MRLLIYDYINRETDETLSFLTMLAYVNSDNKNDGGQASKYYLNLVSLDSDMYIVI